MRAVSYARYSTDLQSDCSIEDQQAIVAKFASSQGYDIIRHYADRARSGASVIGRTGLHDLMVAAENKAFDAVIVESYDRISRSQADLVTIFEQFGFLGIDLIGVSEGKADTIRIGVRGITGSLYLKDLREKTKRGLQGRLMAGKVLVGRAPYGYRRRRGEGDDGKGVLEINDEQAAIVRRVFAEYVAGASPLTIAVGLNKDGIAAPAGPIWAAHSIANSGKNAKGLLSNPLYHGEAVWNRRTSIINPRTGKRVSRDNPPEAWLSVAHPELRIVDEDTWQKAQARLAARRRFIGRPHGTGKGHRFLAGLIRCGRCGAPMTQKSHEGAKGPRLQCNRYRKARACPHKTTYRLIDIEQAVIAFAKTKLQHPAQTADFITHYIAHLERERVGARKQRKQAARHLAGVTAERERMLRQHRHGVISDDEMVTQGRTLNAQIAEAEAMIAAAPLEPDADFGALALDAYQGLLARLEELVQRPESEAARRELRETVDAILVHPAEGAPWNRPHSFEIRGFLAAINTDSSP